MIFQIIDNKRDCFGVYYDGKFIYDRLPMADGRTWNWSHHLADGNYDYAFLYGNGKNLMEICPEVYKERMGTRERRLKAFLNSHINAKIDISDMCLFDLVPDDHLRQYLDVKNQITRWVFENYERPANYTFLANTYQMINEISQQEVRIDWELLKKFASSDVKAMNLSKRIWNTKPTVNYNIFGSVTGRLATAEGSFPILNLKSENRSIVKPKWDFFVELDYNAAEVRTLLSLSGKQQPKGDIHEWNRQTIFGGRGDRGHAKRKFLSWLYNPASDAVESEYYDRQAVLSKFYNNGAVKTPFGRSIECDDFHALNYLLQSSSSDNCLTQAYKIHNLLRHKKSNVAFLIHDSVIIDLKYEDRHLLPQIKEIFQDTTLGNFQCGMKIGKNLGNLQEFSW